MNNSQITTAKRTKAFPKQELTSNGIADNLTPRSRMDVELDKLHCATATLEVKFIGLKSRLKPIIDSNLESLESEQDFCKESSSSLMDNICATTLRIQYLSEDLEKLMGILVI